MSEMLSPFDILLERSTQPWIPFCLLGKLYSVGREDAGE